MVFLEFVEALLGCALVYVTSGMLEEQAAQDNQKSFRTKSVSEETTNVSLNSEYFLSQVKLMQSCSILLYVHLEGEVRACNCPVLPEHGTLPSSGISLGPSAFSVCC